MTAGGFPGKKRLKVKRDAEQKTGIRLNIRG
jgi:hypothetical protein